MKDITKKYSNGEITIVWKPTLCIHSKNCWQGSNGLIEVFNPSEKPWIKPEGASTERIMSQIKKCPSGALSYYMNESESTIDSNTTSTQIDVTENGPLIVHGNITIQNQNGEKVQKQNITALCRCGGSANKPYCDGTHNKIDFKG
ncbi:MAG: (4Fe-4S)-binding protein [Bacteroidia bacterium]